MDGDFRGYRRGNYEHSPTTSEIGDVSPAPQSRRRPFWRRRTILITIVVVVLGGLTAYYFTHKKSNTPLNAAIRSSVTYPIYYPKTSEAPTGYTYKPNSLKSQAGIVFYVFVQGDKEISISEQPSPGQHIGLESLVGFTTFDTPNGIAYVGKQKTGPTALLNTPETLITVTGGLDVPDDAVNSLVKSLRKVE